MVEDYIKSMQDIDIEDYKNNPEFQADIAQKTKIAKEEKDIIKLYEVLDTLILIEEYKGIDEIYRLILEISMEFLGAIIEKQNMLDLENKKEYFYARAIYESAVQNYSNKEYKSAKDLFLVLSVLSDIDFFKGAMQIHMLCALKQIPFEDFMDKYVDKEAIEKEEDDLYFITHFKDEAGKFLDKHSDEVAKEIHTLSKIKNKSSL
jgi:hypothetical protein